MSSAQIVSQWESFSDFDALHMKAARNPRNPSNEPKDEYVEALGQILQTKSEATPWPAQLGIPKENVSYHLWSITKDSVEEDSSIPFVLPASILPVTSAVYPLAVRIFGGNRWQHPYDQSADPTQEQAHCVSLPNHFLVRHYHLRDKSRNESLNISSLSNGCGFSLFVYLPPSAATPAKILFIRVCVFESSSPQTRSGQTPNSPQEHPAPTPVPPPASSTPTEPSSRKSERGTGVRNRENQDAQHPSRSTASPQTALEHIGRFVRMLNPRWKIEDVSSDGNCGYWAALRSLQDLQSRDSSQDIRQWVKIPKTYNALRPQSEDYQLMNSLRVKMAEYAKRRIIEDNWAQLRSCLADVLPLREIEGRPANSQDPLILPPALRPEDIRMEKIQEMALRAFELSTRLILADLNARVSSSTHDSLERYRREAEQTHKLYPTFYRQYLKTLSNNQLWLEICPQDLEGMVKTLKLPVMAIGRVGKMTVNFHDGNKGDTFICDDDQGLETFADSIKKHISEKYPKLVKFIHNGTNHFLAIVEE
ncbi:MAG: hypothetical protein LBD54_00995 [Puniceicoccales bacterium]|nr:hypothetical protein [Puniceicoccales bacterium]